MCQYIKFLLNLLSINYYYDNTNLYIKCKEKFICSICSCNLSNTICYELECDNYGQKILF